MILEKLVFLLMQLPKVTNKHMRVDTTARIKYKPADGKVNKTIQDWTGELVPIK
jgi:hypothetical protein